MGTKIIVIGPHCWGEGADLKTAKRVARTNCPSWVDKRLARFIGYRCHPRTRVTGLGRLAFPASADKPEYLGQV